jgi:hypothetical protein
MVIVLYFSRNYQIIRKAKCSWILLNFLKYLKWITSNAGLFITSLIVFSFEMLIAFLFFFISFSTKNPLDFLYFYHMYRIRILKTQFMIFLLPLTLLDVMLNFKDFCFRPKHFFFLNDPFFFRIQQILIAIVATFEISFLLDYEHVRCLTVSFYHVLASSSSKFFMVFYFSGFILFLTILNNVVALLNPPSSYPTDSIDKLYQDKYLFNLFKEFAEMENSIENLLLFEDIKKYKALKLEDRESFAEEIYFKYLDGEFSALEVNMTKKQRKEVHKKCLYKNFDDDLYSSVMMSVKENLSGSENSFLIHLDTYARFIISSEFLKYKHQSDIIEENFGLLDH